MKQGFSKSDTLTRLTPAWVCPRHNSVPTRLPALILQWLSGLGRPGINFLLQRRKQLGKGCMANSKQQAWEKNPDLLAPSTKLCLVGCLVSPCRSRDWITVGLIIEELLDPKFAC